MPDTYREKVEMDVNVKDDLASAIAAARARVAERDDAYLAERGVARPNDPIPARPTAFPSGNEPTA